MFITSEMQGIVGASKYSQTHGHALGHIHTHIATCLYTQLAQFSLQHIIMSRAKQNHESIYREKGESVSYSIQNPAIADCYLSESSTIIYEVFLPGGPMSGMA